MGGSMRTRADIQGRWSHGFSLIEVLVALLVSMVVMSAVFMLLAKGQESFQREPEVVDVTANARAALDRISRELTIAGFQTPASLPVFWQDGGGVDPDVLTVVYGDPNFPVARPRPCVSGPVTRRQTPTGKAKFGPMPVLSRAFQERRRSSEGEQRRRRGGGSRAEGDGTGESGGSAAVGVPCGEVGSSSTFALDPWSVQPQPIDFEATFPVGTKLMAIQGPKIEDTSCDEIPPAIVSLTVLSEPACTGPTARGSAAQCDTLRLDYAFGGPLAGVTLPRGFDNAVDLSCAVVGAFHVVQYRIDPPPDSARPALQRRDLLLSPVWEPLAENIENLQIQYVQGPGGFEDEPSRVPMGFDPDTFVTRVHLSVSARSAKTGLAGSTAGVFAAGDAHLRRTFSTTVSLRNQLTQAQDKAARLGRTSWN